MIGTLLALAALAGEPEFVPGEAIVAFKKESVPAGLAAAVVKSEPGAQARLDAHLAAVSKQVGIAVRAKRVASGGDVLLAIDLREMCSRLATRLKSEARVAEAASTPAGEEVQVRLAAGASLPDVSRSVSKTFGFALTSRTTPKQEIFLAVDARALALTLVERLRELPEVAYAQANYVVRGIGK